jgi:competence protein ComEA
MRPGRGPLVARLWATAFVRVPATRRDRWRADLDRQLLTQLGMFTSTTRTAARWHRVFASVLALWLLPLPAISHAQASLPAVPAMFKPSVEGQLNINTASVEQWALLPGIGPATAQKLVEYRERHPYRSVSHIMRVKGVGKKTYAAIRPYLTLDGETTLQASTTTQVVVESPAPW